MSRFHVGYRVGPVGLLFGVVLASIIALAFLYIAVYVLAALLLFFVGKYSIRAWRARPPKPVKPVKPIYRPRHYSLKNSE